jgi:uncharacterized protein YcbX
MLIGYIQEIMRYPVKSFQGESVQKTRVMDYGLYGDRSVYASVIKTGEIHVGDEVHLLD